MTINRRRFFGYSTALAATACASWLGHRHLNRMPDIRVNRAGMALGHALRDGQLKQMPRGEYTCHTLILGSGAAALAAAWYLHKHGRRDVLLAEGFERNGNNAGFYQGDLRAPSGAHYLALPSRESRYVREILRDLGILQSGMEDWRPKYCETDLIHAPQERLLYQQRWQDSVLPEEDKDSKRFFSLIARLKHAYGRDGRKLFAIPIVLSSADSAWRKLDSMTFSAWLEREGYRSPGLRWYLDYCCRDDYGQGIDAVSAFAGLHYFAARGNDDDAVLTWPDGLAHLSDKIRDHIGLQTLAHLPEQNHLAFERISALQASAIAVKEEVDAVNVLLLDHARGDVVRIRARQLISAMPLNVATRVIENPQRYGLHGHLLPSAPWLVSNFIMKRFPREKEDYALAWDNVVHGTAGLGYVVASHQLIRVAKPEKTVFTAYTALNHDHPQRIRQWLVSADEQALLRHAAVDLHHAYGENIWQDVECVDITVRGHGMSVPIPGYLHNPLLQAVRGQQSRIAFAHSDMSGYSVYEEAVYWGVQAAQRVLAS